LEQDLSALVAHEVAGSLLPPAAIDPRRRRRRPPFDPRLGRQRGLLPFLPPLRRRCRLRRVVLLVDLDVLLFFFVDVLRAVSEPVVATPRRRRDVAQVSLRYTHIVTFKSQPPSQQYCICRVE
jgi:hypothetical protein